MSTGSEAADCEPRRIELRDPVSRIGRAADNNLVLSDPSREVSNHHCVIETDGAQYFVTDRSRNGTFVGDPPERLPPQTPRVLSEGLALRIGDYVLTVVAISPSQASVVAPQAGRGARPRHSDHAGGALPNFGRMEDGLFGDPFADPGGFDAEDAAAFRPTESGRGNPFAFEPRAGGGSEEPLIPEDLDFLRGPTPENIWHGASAVDHASPEQEPYIAPRIVAGAIPDDWDFSDLVPTDPTSNRSPTLRAEVEPIVQPSAPERNAATPPSGAAGEAVASFFAAAGLHQTALSAVEAEKLLRVVGETMRAAVQGLMEILAARASTKQEFRIERTVIAAMENNPLKFSPSADDALRLMFQNHSSGYLPAKRAVEEALNDIKSHQLAVLAGTQAALMTVLAQFDPAELEKRLDQSSLLDGFLPAMRKARYWESFKVLYGKIAADAQDDFQKAFGAEFARAYQELTDRL